MCLLSISFCNEKWSKKRPRGCSTVAKLGSKSFNPITVADQVDNVFNSKIPDSSGNALNTDQNRVFSRSFYNSAVSKRDIQSLLAKNSKNKYKVGKTSKIKQNNQCGQNCLSTVSTQGKCDTP